MHAAGVGVCLLLAAALYLIEIRPSIERREVRQAHHAELTAQEGVLSQLQPTADVARSDLESVQARIAETPVKLRPASKLNEQLAALAALAKASGVEVEQFERGAADRADAGFEQIPLRMAGTGTYRSFASFLRQVHQTCADVGVASFDLSSDARGTDGAARFEVDLIWHAAPSLANRPGNRE